MDTGNLINRGSSVSWERLFYSVEVDSNQITIKERTLNIFQRILRFLFGAYHSTIWTQKKINQLFEYFPKQEAKINDLVAKLNFFKKGIPLASRATPFLDTPLEIKLRIFNKLDGASLGNCQRVCRNFNTIITQFPNLWRDTFAAEHDGYLPVQISPSDWRQFYIQQKVVTDNIVTRSSPEPIITSFHNQNIAGGFSYNNDFYLVSSNKHELLRYDLTTGKQTFVFDRLPTAAFTETGSNSVAMANISSILRPIDATHFLAVGATQFSIWDASKNSCVFAVNNLNTPLVHAEESRVIYYSNQGCLEIWDFSTKKRLAQIEDPSLGYEHLQGRDTKLSGNLFFVLMNDGFVYAYDIAKGKKLYALSSGNHCLFTKLLATKNHIVAINERRINDILTPETDEENLAYVFSASNGAPLNTIKLRETVNPHRDALFAEIAQNQLIGIPYDTPQTIACWDLDSGAIVKRFEQGTDINIHSFKVGCGNKLVVANKSAPLSTEVVIWDLNTEALLSKTQHLCGCNYFNTCLKIHNNILYCARWPKKGAFFWDLATSKPLGTFHLKTHHFYNTAWHFDGARFFVQRKKEIRIYNLNQIASISPIAQAGRKILSMATRFLC